MTPGSVTTHVYVLGRIGRERLFPPDQIASVGLEFVHADEEGMFSCHVSQPGLPPVAGGFGGFAGATGTVIQRLILKTTVVTSFVPGTAQS